MKDDINAILHADSASGEQDILTQNWLTSKRQELGAIGVTAAIASASVTGCFSLDSFNDSHWATKGLFFGSLGLSIVAMIAVLQQTTALASFGTDARSLKRIRAIISKRQDAPQQDTPTPERMADASDERNFYGGHLIRDY
ncbi:hypothetical protein GP486_008356 [Trichoglossum hirsutum]|uniref:Transmembrane protein n=1 Tax=Trichoglossum hirsutum TaxID=265104 RepID=A0A9P8IA59_9PEZI|nr:hypothetical protein GP486_008356 [Trichoglossum hirsutum]